jgi:thiol:disulfide interchange protein DsbD
MKNTLLAAILTLPVIAEETATATWTTDSMAVKQGETIRTVIAMTISEGWHTYWENPGEGGIPPEIEATLPEGWKIGGIQYPVPERFMTGDLPSYGYQGKILFPLTLTPPHDFRGQIPEITATLSWLACNDEACLPGKATMALATASEAKTISEAYLALPKAISGAKLTLEAQGKNLLFTLTAPQDFDPSPFDIFPATRNVIDPAAKLRFERSAAGTWTATAPKSEYFEGEPAKLRLVLATPGKGAWKISTAD